MPLTTGELITAAITGGLGAKLLDLLHDEWKRRAGERRSAGKVVDQYLDPILKSADELVGKVRSLALEDFRPLRRSVTSGDQIELIGTVYLFADFWSRLQILRAQGEFVVLGASANGRKLQSFIRALESRRIRLVGRTIQRAIGESLVRKDDRSRSISLAEFLELAQTATLKQLLVPLQELLSNPHHTANRQRVLAYGAVVHALIDHLDPRHRVTRLRTGWGNKLTKRTRSELFFRVFREYLPFVHSPERYTKSPRKGLSARRALARHQASDTLIGRLLVRLAHHTPRWVWRIVPREWLRV
jgi:hypothetical protein